MMLWKSLRELFGGTRSRKAALQQLRLECLEDRTTPAVNIWVVPGPGGSGTLDSFLGAYDGTITTSDAPGVSFATISIGALQSINSNVDINIFADNQIVFDNIGVLALQTAAGRTATFTTVDKSSDGQSITVSGFTTIATNGGNLALRAGDDLWIATTALLTTKGGGAIKLSIDYGDADPGIGQNATVPGTSLVSAAYAQLIGGPKNDVFITDSMSSVPILIDGGGEMPLAADFQEVKVGAASISQTGPVGDVVYVNDSFSYLRQAYSVNSRAIQSAPLSQASHGVVHLTNIETVKLTTSTAANVVGVVGSPAPFTTIDNPYRSLVHVVTTDANSVTRVNGVYAGLDLVLSGSGTGSVIAAQGGLFNTFVVNGLGASSGAEITGGASNDIFYVSAISSTSLLSLRGASGNDLFVIGSTGILDGIKGKLGVDGGDGADTLYVSDAAGSAGRTYLMDAARLTRTDLANFEMRFQNVENVQLLGGSGNDIMYLSGQAAGTVVGLYGNGGHDAFSINVYWNTGYTGLVVSGGAGSNSLFVTDRTGGATQRRNSTAFQRTGYVTTTHPGIANSKPSFIQFNAMDAVVLSPDNT